MPKDLERKTPPQSIDAEMALLGAMLIEKDAIIKAMELIREDDFYKEVHKLIFGARKELSDREVAEPVTVSNRLKTNKLFNDAGGIKYLFSLIGHKEKLVFEKELIENYNKKLEVYENIDNKYIGFE